MKRLVFEATCIATDHSQDATKLAVTTCYVEIAKKLSDMLLDTFSPEVHYSLKVNPNTSEVSLTAVVIY